MVKGPNPIGSRSMTSTERSRRSRKRAELLNEEMKKQGYLPVTVYLPKIHIQALNELESSMSDNALNTSKISYLVWKLIKSAVENSTNSSVVKLTNDSNWPVYSRHERAELCANAAFREWAKQQTEGLK